MDSAFFNDISRQQAQQSYMDLNSLQNIRKTSGDDKELGLRQVSQQFESMFIQMMLKSMRSANDVFGKDNPLNSSESKHYQDMYDNQLSLSLSGQNLGIADALYRQLKRNYLSSQSVEQQTEGNDKASVNAGFESLSKYVPSKYYTESFAPAVQQMVDEIPQRIKDASLLNNVASPQEFINAVTPYAKKAADALGVDYRVLIAQSALETGWGEHVIRDKYGNQSFNLFNIKADKRWDGASINVPTVEYVNGVAERENASFRRYKSIEESFTDYQQFLSQPRYQKALAVTADSEKFLQELHKAGYATDPAYSKKISTILQNSFPKSVQN